MSERRASIVPPALVPQSGRQVHHPITTGIRHDRDCTQRTAHTGALVLGVALPAMALVAGVAYSFSVAVMPNQGAQRNSNAPCAGSRANLVHHHVPAPDYLGPAATETPPGLAGVTSRSRDQFPIRHDGQVRPVTALSDTVTVTDDMHVADSIVGVDGQRALRVRGEEQ